MVAASKIKFDRNQALEAAMLVFWKKGYVGASLTDLTEAMAINKPSMYATFGNKETLFVLATDYYMQSVDLAHRFHLEQRHLPLRERLLNYLNSVVSEQCNEHSPKGCYVSLCISEAEGELIPDVARQKIMQVSEYTFNSLTDVFKQDKEAQDLNLAHDAELHACYLLTLLNGTAAMARAGKPCTELKPLIVIALKGLGL
ncbi:TetR/AcrR family transcriptional regulator [Paraglaciecola hydrolytica]|uniref:HTH tetR-type domain-containing protein n=1 Tax=Paraglaciecola hydrolytica TaxID=1799789 RepID=A0A136A5A3_9ALTE|nr:TetR/AcrR family transcriptional regulator [Paraglaciecola hydrolytica]KXI30386.1 hypothetical protein AX660_10480 [Paraglaciecola hydrolytica]